MITEARFWRKLLSLRDSSYFLKRTINNKHYTFWNISQCCFNCKLQRVSFVLVFLMSVSCVLVCLMFCFVPLQNLNIYWLANLVIKTPEFDFFWFRVYNIYDSRAFPQPSSYELSRFLPSSLPKSRQCTQLFISIRSALSSDLFTFIFIFNIYNFTSSLLFSFLIGFRQDCWPPEMRRSPTGRCLLIIF